MNVQVWDEYVHIWAKCYIIIHVLLHHSNDLASDPLLKICKNKKFIY